MSFANFGNRQRDGGSYSNGGLNMAASPSSSSSSNGDLKQVVNQITSNIFNISRQVAKLQDDVSCIGTDLDTHELREKIHNQQENITSIAKETSELLKSLTANNRLGSRLRGEEVQKMLIQQKKLSKDFATQLHRFEEVEKLSMRKEKSSMARVKKNMNQQQQQQQQQQHRVHNEDGIGIDSLNFQNNIFNSPEEGRSSNGVQQQVSTTTEYQTQQQELMNDHILDKDIEYNENIIAEREEAIKDIEHTIVEVNEIFKDLGSLVHDQRSIVDNIESNIYSVNSHVESAHEQIDIAQNYQKKSRNKMCFCLFVLLCILLVLILFLVFFKGK